MCSKGAAKPAQTQGCVRSILSVRYSGYSMDARASCTHLAFAAGLFVSREQNWSLLIGIYDFEKQVHSNVCVLKIIT